MEIRAPAPGISSEVALELSELSKTFGQVTALDSVSLRVKTGTVHALLGENGAGKTTLMRIAFGMIQPDSGVISVRGNRAQFESPADAINQQIGMVHQQFALVPSMSVAENVALGGTGQYRFDSTAELIRSVGEKTGLRLEPNRIVNTLANADRQKLEIIRAFAHDVSILILDEPTTILAETDARDLYRQLRTFAEGGGSVVLITHKLRDAMRHADEVTVLRRGRNVISATVQELTEASVTSAMLGQPLSKPAMPPRDRKIVDPRLVVVLENVSTGSRDGASDISGVNLRIQQGEIVGIVALEGAASTLLRVIAGRVRPLSGSVSIPAQVGFVPEDRQRDAILPEASLFDNLVLHNAGHRHGLIDWGSIRERTASVVRQFDVRTDRPETPARMLSGGNQQRFVLGRELQNNPSVIVLENPTQGLDVQAAAAIHDRMRIARDSGTAVIIYSSDIDEIVELSDRVLVVSNGRLISVESDRNAIGRALLGVDFDGGSDTGD